MATVKDEPIEIWLCRRCNVAGFMSDAMNGRCWDTGTADGKRRDDCPLPLPKEEPVD